MVRNSLLICGILAMVWYVIINILVPIQYPGYDVMSQTVSELSAIDAPTRSFWTLLCIFYSLLFLGFGIGVWLSAKEDWRLKLVASVIVFDALLGFFWPPMHQRQIIAAGKGTLTDILHIAWAIGHLILMLMMIGYAAASQRKTFRIFSWAIVIIFLVFGLLTARDSRGMEANLPTPYLGIWERINIGAYMLWVVVFAIILIRRNESLNEASLSVSS